MQMTKRAFLKGSIALLAVAALPRTLWAAAWPTKAFDATEMNAGLRDLFGTDVLPASDKITQKVPEIAENGAVVPVSIKTSLENVESISIVVEKNPRPIVANFEIPAGTLTDISSRIKMAKTSDVTAVIKTSNGIYSTARQVKVTIGGCGG
jgi:sulfur-oxidizing protein SoxY